MLKVSNKKQIRHLAVQSFKASKMRNLMAVLAIILTTVLFTALFTVGFSMNDAYQYTNFRQIGTIAQGMFKNLTKEQYEELKEDPLIQEYGVRRVVGMGSSDMFPRNHVEVSSVDANVANWMSMDFLQGGLPKEGTTEAAVDLEVLKLLGVEPKIGEKFTLPIEVINGQPIKREFTLCGWWEKDPVSPANIVCIAESQVNEILQELKIQLPYEDQGIGSWQLDVMFSDDRNIEENLNTILEKYGYQSEDSQAEDTYIAIGVNWGYTAVQFSDNADPMTMIGIFLLLILMMFTGYLIIYNIFRISVTHDIRFFGLLKTIGATGKQIKSIIHRQVMLLCIIGVPIGCMIGWLIGGKLSPLILKSVSMISYQSISVSPIIFIGSAIFSIFTVFISCIRPARLAAKISPIEAVKYTESGNSKKKHRKGNGKLSLCQMAMANMGRNKGKTFVTILSLTLAIVLLQITTVFTNGFDMGKYLKDRVASDFIVADDAYFYDNVSVWGMGESAVEPRIIQDIKAHGGVTKGGCIYGQHDSAMEVVSKDWIQSKLEQFGDTKEEIKTYIKNSPHTEDGRVMDDVITYGMDPYPLSCLHVYDGDIQSLNDPNSRKIAAVYEEDDRGELIPDSNWAKVGDTVTLRYVTEWEIYDVETGEVYQNEQEAGTREWNWRPLTYHDEVFTVAAIVGVPFALSYRYYGSDPFVMGTETFLNVNQTESIMLYAFDAKDTKDMETFLANYTSETEPTYSYESKATYEAEFEGFRNMFLFLGAILSFVVGLVGILNFLNVIVTSILSRTKELAMLQSIGMTGKQLKQMLVTEGLLYAVYSIAFALLIGLVVSPIMGSICNKMFWFFTYKPSFSAIFVVAPIFVVLGIVIPMVVAHQVSKKTIVERLRENED